MTTATIEAKTTSAAFDVFRVIERDDERSEWRKVGRGAPCVDGSVEVRLEGIDGDRVLAAVPIDRSARPIPEEKDARRYPSHDLLEGGRRVGAVFVNRDASFTLLIDDGDRDGEKTRLQMRVARSRRSGRFNARYG